MDFLIDSYYLQWPFSMLVLEGVCMWLGFVACTYYVWKIKVSVQNTDGNDVQHLGKLIFHKTHAT